MPPSLSAGITHTAERHFVIISVALMLVALVARVLFAFFFTELFPFRFPAHSDTSVYLHMAERIHSGNPITYFPNGYPLFILLVRSLTGEGVMQALLALNVLMSLGTCFLVFYLVREEAGKLPALLALAVMALWPNQLNYVSFQLTEVPSTFLLVSGIVLGRKHRYVLSALSLSLAAWMRPSIAPVMLFLLVPLVRDAWKQANWRPALRFAGTALFVFAVNMVLEQQRVILPSRNFALNLLFSLQHTSTEGIRFNLEQYDYNDTGHAMALYLKFMVQHPGEFLVQRISSLWELWGPWPSAGVGQYPRGLLSRSVIGIRMLLLFAGLYGFFRHASGRNRWLLLAPAIVITLVHIMTFSEARFTHVAEPLLVVLAFMGMAGPAVNGEQEK